MRIHAEVGKCQRFQRLALGFHDVRQLDEARLVQAQIGGDHRWQVHFQRLQARVDLARDRDLSIGNSELAGEGGLWAAPECGEHLTGLISVVVDRLLAEDDQIGLFLLDQFEQRPRGGQRLNSRVGHHMDRAIGAHGQAVAQVRSRIGRRQGGDHHPVAVPASRRRNASSRAISSNGLGRA